MTHHCPFWLLASLVAGFACMSDMSGTERARENRLRRAAHRQGFLLAKSRRRDARAYGFGMHRLVDEETRTPVAGEHATGYGYDYDVEGYLNRGLS
jgi:hypothetical protein